MRELGYVEGQNIAYEYRYGEGAPDRLATAAAELVQRPVDLIATYGTPAAEAAKEATTTLATRGLVMAGNAHDSRRHAKDCLRLASKMQHEQSRKILLKIAETWRQIAEEQAAWPVAEPPKLAERD